MPERRLEDLQTQVRFEMLQQPEKGRDVFWHFCWLEVIVSLLDLLVLMLAIMF